MLQLKRDEHIITGGRFNEYRHMHLSTSRLVLDGQTLVNLDMFVNSFDGSESGTMLTLLDHCVWPPGRRMFKRWLGLPLRDVNEIEDRLNAVDDLKDRCV